MSAYTVVYCTALIISCR